MYIKVVTVNHWDRDKYLFRDYLNVECYFLHDVNSFRKCFSHLLHTVKILHWLLNISVLFQQLKLPWKQMINRRVVRYLHWTTVTVATAGSTSSLFSSVNFSGYLAAKIQNERLQRAFWTCHEGHPVSLGQNKKNVQELQILKDPFITCCLETVNNYWGFCVYVLHLL